ncbi:uncharacterized protein SAPINGB_P002680 [Magnusiomyces paraingens]|uniref:Delta(14)-sterol reductase n=1 Tax=Magnusiomyces paraingens TaxID=2606893 RepID=A0A5E8BFF6_9ASCO|nr:uncharacterized protein SAPINGB_P002680 [Saprochaete ingens]VVT50259.1 unnamed protein product [Saprochaete ingens]
MPKPNRKLNPLTTEPDFNGWPGALAISIGLPLLFNIFCFTCNDLGCPVSWTSFEPYRAQLASRALFSWHALGVYAIWWSALAILDRIVPGETVEGTLLRDGKTRLKYVFNGKLVMVILFSLLAARAVTTRGALPELVYVYEHLTELMNASLLVAFVGSTVLYLAPLYLYREEPILALGGNTGNPIFDWFIGRELNPRISDFDLKLFNEMRPGLLLWVIINLAMMHHQWLKYGSVSDSMWLVVLFESYYVIEGTFYEQGLINMIDTTTDGFGFMLFFGDLTLVPFSYSLQARYLADHPVHLGFWGVLGCLSVFTVGLLIFRLSNNEKNAFRNNDPSKAHLKYITSKTGSKLLVSGWWGTARHINYFGDWLVAWAYCLPTGFGSILPYYFVFFFAGLLIHRNERDEAKCAEKYGETWVEYKRRVPYKFIPWVY